MFRLTQRAQAGTAKSHPSFEAAHAWHALRFDFWGKAREHLLLCLSLKSPTKSQYLANGLNKDCIQITACSQRTLTAAESLITQSTLMNFYRGSIGILCGIRHCACWCRTLGVPACQTASDIVCDLKIVEKRIIRSFRSRLYLEGLVRSLQTEQRELDRMIKRW